MMTDTIAVQTLNRLARPEVRDLPAYNGGLPSDVVRQRYGVSHVVRLASNENPYGPSPAVARALTNLADHTALYPDANCRALRAAIGARCDARPDEIVMGNGSENLLELLCQVFLSAGDRVLTLLPSFGLHEIYPRMMGASVRMLPVTQALAFDVDAWCAALTEMPAPKMVLLSNPSNPVGCMLDAEAFSRLVLATPSDTLLVIDEAYYEYALLTPGFPDALAVLRAQSRPWIVLRTFSKAWGLAGLRVGYGIASDARLVHLLDKVRTPFNINQAAQTAALAAWNDPDHMARCVHTTVAQRRVMVDRLRSMDVRMAESATNFLFLDLARSNGPVSEALLARGIIVKPWKEVGYEHFIRVSVGTEQENELFLKALETALV